MFGRNDDGRVFGRLDVTYWGEGIFTIDSNDYDFNYHPHGTIKRNAATAIGHAWATRGLSAFNSYMSGTVSNNRIIGTPYEIKFSGINTVK